MQRKQKKKLGEVDLEFPNKGWNPLGDANNCIKDIQKDIRTCDIDGITTHINCASANIEASFYEEQIKEEDMNTLKDFTTHFVSEFVSKCKCKKR